MDPLIGSVTRSIKNLRDKSEFLQQQRDHYVDVRQRMLNLRGSSSSDDEQAVGSASGLVLGDVIISSQKVYKNIGYEYFVEKRPEEVLEFANDQIGLIEEAIEQFKLKIEDGENTLKNIQKLTSLEDGDVLSGDDDDQQGDHLPSMEIREELDEEGNIINSSVTPTSAEHLKGTIASRPDQNESNKKAVDQFEQNLRGKLASRPEMGSGETMPNDDTKSTFSQIDTDSAYTFADLVRQMDEQDEIEDNLDSADIGYDFESFDNSLKSGAQEISEDYDEEDDDDEDDDDEGNFSVFPNMASHNAFMDQIRQLRQGKPPVEEPIEKSVDTPKKSILKKKTDSKGDRPKKSVGFASTLDIHEVESLKNENRINSNMSPRTGMQPLDNEEAGDNLEFDSDLFAQLIGAQGPDEIHDKYKDEVAKQGEHESESGKKRRVSRFRKERNVREKEVFLEGQGSGDSAMSSLVVENDTEPEGSPDDVKLRDTGAMADIIAENGITEPSVSDVFSNPVTSPVEERATYANGEVEGNSGSARANELLVDNNLGKSAMSDLIVEKDVDDPPIRQSKEAMSKLAALSKNMTSLSGLNRSHVVKTPKIQELLESSEDESDEAEPQESKPTSDAFPEAVMEKIEEVERPQLPKVDYTALGEDLESMVGAYALGVYDDDLEDDHGVLLEKVSDFKAYNDHVEQLKNEIEAFKISNPMGGQENDQEDLSDEDGPVMIDIAENDVPESYSKANTQDDLALDPERLQESIAAEYGRLRDIIRSRVKPSNPNTSDEELKQIEPIDEHGNPIKQSRFRSQRFELSK